MVVGTQPVSRTHPPPVGQPGQRIQATLSGPGKEAAQVGFGVLTGGALETGQIGSHLQPQLISERTGRPKETELSSVKFVMI